MSLFSSVSSPAFANRRDPRPAGPGTGLRGFLDRRRLLTAPKPVDGTTLLGGPAPPDATLATSAAQLAAIAAAAKQRKKAAGGSRTTLPGQPTGAGINPSAGLAPRTLLGY